MGNHNHKLQNLSTVNGNYCVEDQEMVKVITMHSINYVMAKRIPSVYLIWTTEDLYLVDMHRLLGKVLIITRDAKMRMHSYLHSDQWINGKYFIEKGTKIKI